MFLPLVKTFYREEWHDGVEKMGGYKNFFSKKFT